VLTGRQAERPKPKYLNIFLIKIIKLKIRNIVKNKIFTDIKKSIN
jgi:hypothetical protein